MRKFFILTFISYLTISSSWAQTRESALHHIQILSAEKFAGRGYVKNGMPKAAKYIQKELKKQGVLPVNKNYFQKTPAFQVNTFAGNIKLEGLNSSEKNSDKTSIYNAGTDFLINPSSGDITLKHQQLVTLKNPIALSAFNSNNVYYIEKALLENSYLKKLEEHFIESKKITNSLLIIYDSSKLTWYPAMSKSKNAVVYINKPINEKAINAQWKSKLITDFQGINILGKVAGKRNDSSIFFTAHYDHLGMLGKHVFPGANDNASGVALLLELAKHYAKNTPEFDTYFLFTCGEELGLIGSYFYIQNPIIPLGNIKLLINFDMVGTGDEGITIVNAKKQHKFFELMTSKNEDHLKAIKARGDACNSDHCLFDRAGVPAVFIYTLGGKQAYHDLNDNAKGLSLYAYNGLFKIITEVIKDY